jgi:GNAT superfamily N-acetyltransferase
MESGERMELRHVTERDIGAIGSLQPPGWPEIVPVFEYYLRAPSCTPVKAVMNGEMAGVGVMISLGRTAWLAHIIVAEEYRRRGVGRFIVARLLESCREAECGTVSLIATEMGYPLYREAGFTGQCDYLLYVRDEPLMLTGISEAVTRPLPGEIGAILDLDRRVSGEDRGAALAGLLENSYVYRAGGGIAGYYLPGFYEGPIIADDPAAGIELMKLRYLHACKGVLPAENREGIDFLEKRGFREAKRVKRMVYGSGFPWRPEGIFGRISGNLG